MTKARLVWGDTLAIGHGSIDQQHKAFVDLVDCFSRALLAPASSVNVDATFAQLVAYVQVHFEEEEELMRTIGYPRYHEHRQLHDTALAAIREVNLRDGGEREKRAFLTEFLPAWLKEHTLGEDLKLAEFLRRHHSVSETAAPRPAVPLPMGPGLG